MGIKSRDKKIWTKKWDEKNGTKTSGQKSSDEKSGTKKSYEKISTKKQDVKDRTKLNRTKKYGTKKYHFQYSDEIVYSPLFSKKLLKKTYFNPKSAAGKIFFCKNMSFK